MAGRTVSFVADAGLVQRIHEIARADGITPSQAAARASLLGTLLPASARRALRFVLAEGGEDARRQLTVQMTKIIAQISNMVLERQLLERAQALGVNADAETEEELAEQAVRAVSDYRQGQQEAQPAAEAREPAGPVRRFGV